MKVTVLHTTNTRNASFNSLEETVTDLLEGKFYVAGTVEVETADDALGEAWQWTQNDYHNMVLGWNPIHPETGNPLPIRWNGEFAQRSSMVGDVFLLETGELFAVASIGFTPLPNYEHKEGPALSFPVADNPWDDGKDGWPEDGKVFNSTFDALMSG